MVLQDPAEGYSEVKVSFQTSSMSSDLIQHTDSHSLGK